MNRGGLGGGRGGILSGGGRGAIFGLPPAPSLGGGRGQLLSQRSGSQQSASSREFDESIDKTKISLKDEFDDLENFKPMQEAYDDPVFNSYAGSGPGTSLRTSQHVDSRREKDVVKLHVANIPSNMAQRAVENIFNLYGDTVSVFIASGAGPTSWGFVEYKRLQEAQNAITNLDRKQPHNLSVKFAKEKEPKQTNSGDIGTPYCKVDTSASNRGRKTLPLHGVDPRKLHSKSSFSDGNSVESNGYLNGQFSNYNPPAQVELNNKVMEKTTSTAQNGNVVRSGRAYAPTHAPPQPKEPDTSTFQNVEKFKKPTNSEEVNKKIRNYIIKQVFFPKKEVNPPEVTCPFKQGNCTNCLAISATVCHVCKAWFCSYTCMENDWGKHKFVCRPKTVTFRPDGTVEYHDVPDDKRDTQPGSAFGDKNLRSYGSDQTSEVPLKKSLELEQQPERRVAEKNKTVDEQPSKPIQTTRDEKPSPKSVQTKIDYVQHPPEPRDDGYVHTQNGLVTSRNAKYEANIQRRALNDSQQQIQPSACSQSTKPSKTAPVAVPAPEPPIPRGIFSECLILYTSPEDEGFSVTPVKLAADQDEMMADLAEYFCQPRASVKNVTEGVICGAEFVDSLWYRVKVCYFNEKTHLAKISFIDFGNEDEVPADGLKVLPDSLVKPPPMAFRIVFVGGKKPFQINNAIEISPIKPTPCGSWLVRTPDDPEPPEEVEEEEALARELPEEIVQEAPVEKKSPSEAQTSYPLSKEKFQPVTIMHVEEPGVFWVITMEGMQGLLELNKSLDDSAKSKVKVSPEKNQLYNYQYSGIWCRALLTSLEPYTVFFIDYGNAEKIDPKGLLPLPLKLKSAPPLAIRIMLAEGTSLKYLKLEEMNTITVRAHGKVSNSILALVEGESYVQSVLDHDMTKAAESAKPKKPNHIVSMLNSKSDAFVTITKAIGEDYFCGSLQIANCPKPYHAVNEISETLKTKKANPSYKPAVNDDVIVKINNDPRLYRGYVMCVEDAAASVALVDIGCVETPCKLTALPPEFKDIPPCGVRVSLHQPITSSMSDLLGNELSLKDIRVAGEEVTADFGDFGRATITPWVPLLEEARIPAFELKNQSQAMITAFHSPQAVYVRPLTPECVDAFSCVIQDVCAFCITAEPLQKPPLLGELVSARWNIDNNFYRALVSKKENNAFKVIFLDFGNMETVVLDDLRTLPDIFKKIPATVVKIGLKDVPGPLFNRNATQLMNDVVAKETKVIVSHEGDLRNVVLTEESSGDVVNVILAQAMEPSWARNPSNIYTVPPYMNTDVRYDLWEEGTKLEGAVVGAPSHHEILFVNRSTLFEYIHSVLTPQMTKYCQESQERAYNPRPNELVLAKFEGDWYRAVSTSEQRMSNNSSAHVFFIDYGNLGEMAIEDMRKMVPEFVHVPAAVKHCKIYGLPRSETISKEDKQKLTEALIDLESIDLVVVKQFENGNSVVWVPSFEKTLTAMGIPYTRPVGFS